MHLVVYDNLKDSDLNLNDINTALTNDNAPSFNYKGSIIDNTVADGANEKKMM